MIPAAFEYEVAESVEHAVGLLGSREDAKLLAGGHSLLPAMRLPGKSSYDASIPRLRAACSGWRSGMELPINLKLTT